MGHKKDTGAKGENGALGLSCANGVPEVGGRKGKNEVMVSGYKTRKERQGVGRKDRDNTNNTHKNRRGRGQGVRIGHWGK